MVRVEEEYEAKNKKQLRSCSYLRIDNRVWAVSSYGHDNAVFSLNMELQDIRLEYSVTVQKDGEVYAFIKGKGDFIYLFPLIADGIIGIDRITGKQKYFNLKDKHDVTEPYSPQDVIEYEGNFYLVPGYLQYPLLKFDGNAVEECSGWREQLQEIAGQTKGVISLQCTLVEDKLYLLLYGTGKVACTDMKTMEIKVYDLPLQSGKYERLEYHQGKFWIIPGGRGDILSFTFEDGIEGRYPIPETFECLKGQTFTFSYHYESFIWFIPWAASSILILNLDRGSFEILRLPEVMEGEPYLVNHPKVEAGFVDGHYLKLLAFGGNYHCLIDLRTKKFVQVIDSRIPDSLLLENNKAIFRSRNIWPHGRGTLADFVEEVEQINMISQSEDSHSMENAVNAGCKGRDIWNCLKEKQTVSDLNCTSR